MTLTLNVAVSQALLDEMALIPIEQRGDEHVSPLQRAIVYELGAAAHSIEVSVFRDEVRLRNQRYDETYVNPEWLRKWMDKWDRGEEVQPISIEYKHGKMFDRADWSRRRSPTGLAFTKLD